MIINNPEVKKIVTDYDIIFSTGIKTGFTIDPSAGDEITFGNSGAITVKLAAKASPSDPSITIPEEDITIFAKHILYVNKRVREVIEPSPEEKAELNRVWKELTSTIQ